MTDGIRRRNVIREMQKRTIGEALYSKKLGRKPSESAKKIGVLPARQRQSKTVNSRARAWHSADSHSNGKAVNESGKLTAYKKVIDGLIFVEPSRIRLDTPGEITICQRSLRAQTAQGERTELSSSEECPAGTTCEMTILCLDDAHEKAVREWLDYGALRGIGQWRNSSKGRFKWEEVK